ncbi:hypothetical protein RchiOBHm_Chr3g0497361 [Rosa chinensis]|uniref:Uncharacterized protein n=1 Tax=Rosa chinensis TaxID=74649 RepID=A0A2P6RHP1_ROSCH|nr:hypothetical protein RchiOBHm_Chr3g0497361 [Rosa chinensis]
MMSQVHFDLDSHALAVHYIKEVCEDILHTTKFRIKYTNTSISLPRFRQLQRNPKFKTMKHPFIHSSILAVALIHSTTF